VTLHKNLIDAVKQALTAIFFENRFADHVIEYVIKSNKKWGGRDRKFIAETTYTIVRNWRMLHALNGTYDAQSPKQLDKILAIYFSLAGEQIPEWLWTEPLNVDELLRKKEELSSQRVVRESIPDWLDAFGLSELGEQWEKELPVLNQKADVIIRTNTLKITKPELMDILESENVHVNEIPGYPHALRMMNKSNLFMTQAFKDGLFEIQDASSQLVAEALDVEPGQRVVDACAGSGGKALHIGSLMRNRGKIIALDITDRRLGELRHRAKRDGIEIVETRIIDSTKVIKRLYDSADRLLLDVPCSGSGVLRRHPDAKWKLNIASIKQIRATQEEILGRYSRIVKPGGIMVYSTCSIFPSENEKQVEKFLALNKQFELLEDRKVSPAESGFDGFYIAKIRRKSDIPAREIADVPINNIVL
jgi:16S rRNA (cytosine967-C5)-methyltransferase